MKKNIFLFSLLALGALLILASVAPLVPASIPVKYSKKVDSVIKDKCYGCHSPNSQGEKSRNALNWDELGNIETAMQLKKFQAIEKVLEDGAMPPKRFVEGNPDKKLTEKETKTLKKWAAKLEKKASK